MKKWLKAFGKGVGYVGVFVSSQVLVLLVVEMVVGISITMSMKSAQGEGPLDSAELETAFVNGVLNSAALMIIISGIIAVGIVAIIFKVRKKNILKEIDFRPIDKKTILHLVLIGVSYNILISGILACLLSGSSSLMESYAKSANTVVEISVLNFIATVVVAPFAEEVFCRGLMLSRFRRGMSTTFAILLQAFFFGLLHGNLVWSAYTIIFGVMLGIIACREKSIASTIIIHATFNLTAFVINVIGVGDQSYGIYILMILLSATILVGVFYLLRKKYIMERRVIEEVEVLEVADLEVGDWMLDTKFHE